MVTDRQAAPAEPTTKPDTVQGLGLMASLNKRLPDVAHWAEWIRAIEAEARQPSPGLREALEQIKRHAERHLEPEHPHMATDVHMATYDLEVTARALAASAEPAGEPRNAFQKGPTYQQLRDSWVARPPVAGPDAGEEE